MSKKPYYEQQGVAMTCRSYEEYVRMFSLRPDDLGKGPVLDVAAGASSFVAEANARGLNALAVDPMYSLDPDEIQAKGIEEIEISTSKLRGLQEHFDWSYYGNIDNHRSNRVKSLATFVADFREKRGARYVAAFLPELPFADESFKLVLCSHFLFLYGEQFDLEFHKSAIAELLRVCRQDGRVLIYPLKTLAFDQFTGLSDLLAKLPADEVEVKFLPSQLPFIPGSTELLSLMKR